MILVPAVNTASIPLTRRLNAPLHDFHWTSALRYLQLHRSQSALNQMSQHIFQPSCQLNQDQLKHAHQTATR
jgi:hypothetical protein